MASLEITTIDAEQQEAVSTLTDGAESLTSVASPSPSPSPSPVVVSTTEAIPTVNALAQTLMDELPARHAPLHIHFGAGRLGLGLLVPSIAASGVPFCVVQRPSAEFQSCVGIGA
eukprot:CAMPEP_0119497728 /NCGR_PEP_ID=MMETSP1344-20130328/20691_1 /TAXON_ID=236787 /ORGANISM="Florenciella parvula, Strain CCMP2471" /LENGTH=114 /DNA_ID=CAMNT_0007533537 /DNA_START=293 /DNA_END=633 /DNA_ORIENTATION=-